MGLNSLRALGTLKSHFQADGSFANAYHSLWLQSLLTFTNMGRLLEGLLLLALCCLTTPTLLQTCSEFPAKIALPIHSCEYSGVAIS
jgi:hypothetical protein